MNKIYNTKYYLELYRQEYEEYMEVNSKERYIELFTEQEQIQRYSKHLSFWLMKFDLIQLNKPPDYDTHSTFLLQAILKTQKSIHEMFPKSVIDTIKTIANETRDIHKKLITGFSI